jgi:1-pyrroline-5-carboxylate dehydrogenase
MAIYSYKTEPLTDFSLDSNKQAYLKGLDVVSKMIGKTYPIIIDGKRIETEKKMDSINPANHQEVIGSVYQATKVHAEEAMQKALLAFETWKFVHPETRAEVLFKAAGIIRKRKFEFCALLTKEGGKPWPEADADVAETIDFLEYYGRQMISLTRIDDVVLSRRNIEKNKYEYIPLGVGIVIAPWNFPLAILAGMTSAAIVSGNTVIMKPASPTMIIAYKFIEVLEEAGLPNGVCNFVPGSGREIGEYLVTHPKTRFISFTGSKEVGISIYEKAAVVQKGQLWLKRVIAEMGGKDTIIVDETADLDLAADAIIKSAFGFSGQKCSACSRAVIHQDVYDIVIEKMLKIAKTLKVGDPSLNDTFMGPVIDQSAFKSITSYFEVGKVEGKLILGGTANSEKGYYIDPTIYIDLDPKSRLMQEEIFGPILAVAKAKSFDELLEIANNTEFGLTGAIISKNLSHIERAKKEFHVGNLYINRKCTGAIVGYQPFGGFNMSGTDSKAGGPDYLVLHLQGKTIGEAL